MSEPLLRALVVDDSAADREMLLRRLRRAGFWAAEAHCGEAALETLEQADFDIVLLDVNMPGMSGFDVLANLRSHRAADVPVVMVSASNDRLVETTSRQLGAVAFITKPVDFSEALATFRAHAERCAAARLAAE